MSGPKRVVPFEVHRRLIVAAFQKRGYDDRESNDFATICDSATRHGITSHNGLKALHLDTLFGIKKGGCHPGATIEKLDCRFTTAEVWDAHLKAGPSIAYEAIAQAERLAEQHGIASIAVDNAWHYLWGGGYVLQSAERGFIAFTQCTAMKAEVAPYGGQRPSMGTNPHSWALPTQESIGFPILVDWATSAIAMGRVQQLQREGKNLPSNAALDTRGQLTRDPAKVAALLPFGAHKGYGLGLINEVIAGFIGGSSPTLRGQFPGDDEKHACCYQFIVIHPDALSAGRYAGKRSRKDNLKVIIEDIRQGANKDALLPGEREFRAQQLSEQQGGLFFSEAEITAFTAIAREIEFADWVPDQFPLASIG